MQFQDFKKRYNDKNAELYRVRGFWGTRVALLVDGVFYSMGSPRAGVLSMVESQAREVEELSRCDLCRRSTN